MEAETGEAPPLGLAHVAALLGVLGPLVGLLAVAARPPAVRPASAPASDFSAARAMDDVRGLTAGNTPHPVGSPDHARARAFVEGRLRALGLEPTVQIQEACDEHRGARRCETVQNVLARISGSGGASPGRAVLLAAHYDSVPGGPGAGDDGAGVATLFEIARALTAAGAPRPTNDVILLVDDGEEAGLLGARAFVSHHPWARDVRVALNFEARGNLGQTSMFETSERSAWLVELYGAEVARPTASSLIYALYKQLPNDTDLTVFKEAGMLGLNFAFADRVSDYHTRNDNADRLDPRSLQHMGDQGLAVARALSSADLGRAADAEEVYFDLFSIALVRYRAGWVVPLAIAGFVALAAAIRSGVRRRVMRLRAVARGALLVGWALFAASIAAALVHRLLLAASGRARPPLDAPMPTWIALVAVAVAAASAAQIVLVRSPADALSAWAGVTAVFALLSALTAIALPGGSYLFALPVLAGAAGIALAARTERTWARLGLATAAIALAGLLWLPIARILLVMVGVQVPLASALPVALFATLATPVLAGATGRARLVVPALAACTAVVAVVSALVAS